MVAKYEAKAEMLVRSAAEAAFDAFVDPDMLVRFWLAASSAPLALGARVRWDFMVPGAHEVVFVTALERPAHLAFEWSGGTHVHIRFLPSDGRSAVVSVVASGFPTADEAVGATEGFTVVLCDLKTLLESGTSAGLVRDKATLIAKRG